MHLQPPPIDETPEQAAALAPMRTKARSLVGGLVYIEQVHPGISHALARCCSLMAMPTMQMYVAAKRILAWLAACARQTRCAIRRSRHSQADRSPAPWRAASAEGTTARRVSVVHDGFGSHSQAVAAVIHG